MLSWRLFGKSVRMVEQLIHAFCKLVEMLFADKFFCHRNTSPSEHPDPALSAAFTYMSQM